MPEFDLESVDRLLTTTKAVRRRLDLERPVPREVLLECIDLACHSPNASNAQEWFWVVVDEPEQKRRVAEIYREVLEPRVKQMLETKVAAGDEPGARISAHTVLAMVIAGPPKPVHELAPAIPAELCAICEKGMARDPADRYASIVDFADDLHAYLDNRVVTAHRTGAWIEFRKWVQRNKALAASMANRLAELSSW